MLRRTAGLVCVLDQIDERLFELRAIKPARLSRQRAHNVAALCGGQLIAEAAPLDESWLRRRQLCEGRIARNELMQMLGTLADRIECRSHTGLVASLCKLTARLRQGGDRPERIVELMTQHTNQ